MRHKPIFWSAHLPRGGVSFDPSFAQGSLEFSVDGAQRAHCANYRGKIL
jgi:hypothetical protein